MELIFLLVLVYSVGFVVAFWWCDVGFSSKLDCYLNALLWPPLVVVGIFLVSLEKLGVVT